MVTKMVWECPTEEMETREWTQVGKGGKAVKVPIVAGGLTGDHFPALEKVEKKEMAGKKEKMVKKVDKVVKKVGKVVKKVEKTEERVEKKVEKEDKEEKKMKDGKVSKVGKKRSKKLEVEKLKEVKEVKELKEKIKQGRKVFRTEVEKIGEKNGRCLIFHVSGKQVKEDRMENLPQLDGNNDFFFCEVCSKTFSSKYSLQRHLKTVCQEEPALVAGEHSLFFSGNGGKKGGEKCATCGNVFSRLDALQKHCQKVHNMKKGDPGYPTAARDQGQGDNEMMDFEFQVGSQGEEAGAVEMMDMEFQVGSQGEEAGDTEMVVCEPDIQSFGDVLKGLEEEDRKKARDRRAKAKKDKETEAEKEKVAKGGRKEKEEERAENGKEDPRDFALPIKRREQRFAVSECKRRPWWDRHILEKDLFLTPSPVVNPQRYQTLDDSNAGLVPSEGSSEEGAASSGAQLPSCPDFDHFLQTVGDVSLRFCEEDAATAEDCDKSGSKEPELSGVQLPSSPASVG